MARPIYVLSVAGMLQSAETSMGQAVIRTRALTKRYGPTVALDGLDLEVRRGEVYGFLGPNGAIVYALVTVLFLWQLFGSLLGAPRWLIDVSPFVHLGFAPARPFRIGPVAVMLVLGAVTATAAVVRFARRDIVAGS